MIENSYLITYREETEDHGKGPVQVARKGFWIVQQNLGSGIVLAQQALGDLGGFGDSRASQSAMTVLDLVEIEKAFPGDGVAIFTDFEEAASAWVSLVYPTPEAEFDLLEDLVWSQLPEHQQEHLGDLISKAVARVERMRSNQKKREAAQ